MQLKKRWTDFVESFAIRSSGRRNSPIICFITGLRTFRWRLEEDNIRRWDGWRREIYVIVIGGAFCFGFFRCRLGLLRCFFLTIRTIFDLRLVWVRAFDEFFGFGHFLQILIWRKQRCVQVDLWTDETEFISSWIQPQIIVQFGSVVWGRSHFSFPHDPLTPLIARNYSPPKQSCRTLPVQTATDWLGQWPVRSLRCRLSHRHRFDR